MKLIAKTLYGLENVLSEELKNLGATEIETANRAVIFNGDKNLLYKVNYCSRTALSVLVQIADFRIRSKEDLTKGGLKIEWDQIMDNDDTFSIVPVVNSPLFTHTGYAGLILKDCIADYFRNKTGRRPSVDTTDPRILINLHISNEHVTISIDSSIVPLFKRGYRKEQSVAPLNEVLAAGILKLSGWTAGTSLTDPMCGSGTIPIEAAMIACKIPPGKFRKSFGFQKWKDFDEKLYSDVVAECDSHITEPAVKIFASDISEVAVRQANVNIEGAGLKDIISISVEDFRNLKKQDEEGFIFLNPPYGERLLPGETDSLYGMIGTTLKHNFTGYTAWLISSNKDSLKKIGLKHREKLTLFNGALECTLIKYELYQGTKKIVRS
jgi:putative N6-adenine-specific DNA methylase